MHRSEHRKGKEQHATLLEFRPEGGEKGIERADQEKKKRGKNKWMQFSSFSTGLMGVETDLGDGDERDCTDEEDA